MKEIESFSHLVAKFASLPGVGQKTATRYAYSVISMSEDAVAEFSKCLVEVKNKVHFCNICGNYTDREICDICQSRKSDIICVVKEPKDVVAFEKIKEFDGVYHVLHGTLNPLAGIGPDDIDIKGLLRRLDGVQEIIMATNPDVEGEATATYVARLLKPFGIKVTRIAHGIPIGSDIEFADEVTLGRALMDRKTIG